MKAVKQNPLGYVDSKWHHFAILCKDGAVDTFWDGNQFATIKTGDTFEIWIPPIPKKRKR